MPTQRRRAHKKSRNGCLDCKQRHTKCDETRPQCGNCRVVGRQCRYAEIHAGAGEKSKTRATTVLGPRTAASAPGSRGRPGHQAQFLDENNSHHHSCSIDTRIDNPSVSIEAPSSPQSSAETEESLHQHEFAPEAVAVHTPGSLPPLPVAPFGSLALPSSPPPRQSAPPSLAQFEAEASLASSGHAAAPSHHHHSGQQHRHTHSSIPLDPAAWSHGIQSSLASSQYTTNPPATATNTYSPIGQEINIDHAELLIHFITKTSAAISPELGPDLLSTYTQLTLDRALGTHSLLYESLAISARHLAYLRPDRWDFYFRQAVQLQTRALELFNATVCPRTLHGTGGSTASINNNHHHSSNNNNRSSSSNSSSNNSNNNNGGEPSSCEATILFAAVLNRHLLADCLSNHEGDCIAFLDRFVRSTQLQRGIRALYSKNLPLLLQSPLAPMVRRGNARELHAPALGTETKRLAHLIATASTLDGPTKDAFRSAVHFLQVGFDDWEGRTAAAAAAAAARATTTTAAAAAQEELQKSSRFRVAFSWGLYVPDRFFDMLRQRRPEAVVVMGWYAVLLHYARGHWVVGDAAGFVLRCVLRFVGPEWAEWLQWPVEVLAEYLV